MRWRKWTLRLWGWRAGVLVVWVVVASGQLLNVMDRIARRPLNLFQRLKIEARVTKEPCLLRSIGESVTIGYRSSDNDLLMPSADLVCRDRCYGRVDCIEASVRRRYRGDVVVLPVLFAWRNDAWRRGGINFQSGFVNHDQQATRGYMSRVYYRESDDFGVQSQDWCSGYYVSSFRNMQRIFGCFARAPLGLGLCFHLPQRFLKLRLTIGELFLTDQPSISLGFLSEQDRFLRSVSRLLSYIRLPSAYASSDESENDEQRLRPENFALNRRLLVFIFPVLYLLSVVGCLVTISLGGQEDDPPNATFGRLLMLAVFILIGQWSVFEFLKRVFGGIMRTDETRISRRTEGRGEFRAAGAGCVSGPQSGEPKRPARKPTRRKKTGSDKGLERFLLPRPCLRRVAPCC